MGSRPLIDAVTKWLENIPACDDSADSCHARDGSLSILAFKSQKRKHSHLQIPSPPVSEIQPHHHHNSIMPSQPGTPKKRKIATAPDDQVDDDTPRPLRLADKSETPSLSSLSSQSLMGGSQHSGRSSPSKLASHLRVGYHKCEATKSVASCSPTAHLPSIERLKSTSRSLALLRGSAYMDSDDIAMASPETIDARFPEKHLNDIMEIVDIAKECQGADIDETCWNNHVHSPLLHAALNRRPVPGQPISFTAYMNASMTANYRVSHIYSSKVDYAIFINPILDTPEPTNTQRAVQHLQRHSPESSVNHTGFSLLRDRPIAISIETKRYGGQERKAEFQLGSWLAAQWKLLAEQAAPEGLRELPFIPGIIVNGHEWKMVAATYADGKTKLWTNQEFGTTRSVLRTFQIVAALRRLRKWSLEEYWPWYKRYVLKIGSDEGIETIMAETSS
ncbi:uncharacterized protein NECHADRAFT_88651 [Fusarium vanettenii 77-13-4]|uniref:PD-(D/E)XK nuclease-like domain-containing protein n=1 Tax=Fusarium vanettenii (strain ATCC MYA-4622 / CBS 123669 / FGSC 9596 / NRRL 45880 / 77-13-4) TaxID=660122 RepID=C7ZBS8_FUSV7|nr:uncharacterized protein NECHADRAFT_88651 [Fusarium vanettenii 77-13-4]EEU38524.1 hypothetical protein NECHADRAFT_88651 [Fusarium vanettenii 77-13-4]